MNGGYMGKLASIIIVTYNHRKYLESCIDSLLNQDYPYEIILVDNCSQDRTSQFIKEKYPGITFIQSEKNIGYGAGNNLGTKHAKGEYLVFLNPDTIVDNGWLRELIKPFTSNKKMITTPKILTYDGSVINTCGTINHFTGLTFTRGYTANPSYYQKQEYVSGFSGCCFAIKKEDFISLRGFDENFFCYNEDSELSWRALKKGYKILFVPSSTLRHDYTLKVIPEKIYHLEKGRYIILRKYFSWKDVVLLLPSLIMAELLTFGYAAKCGRRALRFKIKAIKDGFAFQIKVDKNNSIVIFKQLNFKIPLDQLTYNWLEKAIKVAANYIFKWNLRLLR